MLIKGSYVSEGKSIIFGKKYYISWGQKLPYKKGMFKDLATALTYQYKCANRRSAKQINLKEEIDMSKDLITLAPIDPKAAEESITEATGILEKAKQYEIKTQEGYTHIAQSLQIIKGKIKLITEKRKELTSPINEAKTKVMDLFRPALDAYSEAEVVAKKIMKIWDDEQDKKIAQQQEKLRLQTEKKEQKRKRET